MAATPLHDLSPPSPGVLDRLRTLVRREGLGQLDLRLAEMTAWLGDDLGELRGQLAEVGNGTALAERASRHLLDLEGKYLRPLCVLIAARAGEPDRDVAIALASSVELVHSATLLHDDVVDLGERRRGRDAARVVYGNAASIFAGDLLLVEALRRIRRSGLIDLLDAMLAVIDEMIRAESIQLEHRGRLHTSAARYLEVVEGKTAALFGWACRAGGRAGGLDAAHCDRLADFGAALGVAFQIRDDMLDFTGAETGKDLLADLREGKSTYPLIWALERKPALAARLAESLAAGGGLDSATVAEVRAALETTGALEASRHLARAHTDRALAAVSTLDRGRRAPLEALALAALHRDL
jgi:octaprenyl-diphosphate synthase